MVFLDSTMDPLQMVLLFQRCMVLSKILNFNSATDPDLPRRPWRNLWSRIWSCTEGVRPVRQSRHGLL